MILTHQAFDEPAYRPMLVLPERTVRQERCLLAVPSEGPRTHGIVRIGRLEAVAGKVVILEPILRTPLDFDPLDCLSSGKPVKECTYRMNDTPTRQELFYRSLDDHRRSLGRSTSTGWYVRICPSAMPVLRGDIVVKRDGSHLTVDFAKSPRAGHRDRRSGKQEFSSPVGPAIAAIKRSILCAFREGSIGQWNSTPGTSTARPACGWSTSG